MLTHLNYTRAALLVIDAIQIVNQLLEFSLEIEIGSVVQQRQERGVTSVGFDGVWMILLGSGDVGISETL
jgi:hypothetical protein